METQVGKYAKNDQPLDVEWMISGFDDLKGSMWRVEDLEACKYVRLSQPAALDLLILRREIEPRITVDQFCLEVTVSAATKDWLNERMGAVQ